MSLPQEVDEWVWRINEWSNWASSNPVINSIMSTVFPDVGLTTILPRGDLITKNAIESVLDEFDAHVLIAKQRLVDILNELEGILDYIDVATAFSNYLHRCMATRGNCVIESDLYNETLAKARNALMEFLARYGMDQVFTVREDADLGDLSSIVIAVRNFLSILYILKIKQLAYVYQVTTAMPFAELLRLAGLTPPPQLTQPPPQQLGALQQVLGGGVQQQPSRQQQQAQQQAQPPSPLG